MTRFRFEVNEIQNREMVYEVEADTEAEAYRKAAIGDTIAESATGRFEVIDRIVEYGDPAQ